MGLNPSFNFSSNLGSRDMDQNHDWINDLRQRYSDMNLINIDTFLNIDSRVNIEIEENLIIDY